jgi:hypothetical protein
MYLNAVVHRFACTNEHRLTPKVCVLTQLLYHCFVDRQTPCVDAHSFY